MITLVEELTLEMEMPFDDGEADPVTSEGFCVHGANAFIPGPRAAQAFVPGPTAVQAGCECQ